MQSSIGEGDAAPNGCTIVESEDGAEILKPEILFQQIEYLRQRFPDANMNACFERLEKATDIMAETAAIENEFKNRGSGDGASEGGQSQEHLGVVKRQPAWMAHEQVSGYLDFFIMQK